MNTMERITYLAAGAAAMGILFIAFGPHSSVNGEQLPSIEPVTYQVEGWRG